MPTTNPVLSGPSWQLIVNEGDEFFLSLPETSQTVYVSTGDPPAANLLGHTLAAGQDSINRALIGPGPVFARCHDPQASVTVALTAWTPV